MKKTDAPHPINSVSELHRLLSLPRPDHPLLSVIDLKKIGSFKDFNVGSVVFNFYSIWLERGVEGKFMYGQSYLDFDEGTLIFISPGQVLQVKGTHKIDSGMGLIFHPDFILNYPLGKTIKNYGFFSYAVNEALHLSEKEESMILSIMENILEECQSKIDRFSQGIILSQIELLLQQADRYYHRQFITRNHADHELLTRVETLLKEYFNSENHSLPTVQQLAAQVHLSPNYLSDMLRTITGQNAQQHIHNKLIEKAKELISATSLSVSEISYRLGFEHSQSFSKLFKNKTNLSPLEFRRTFN